MNVKPWWPGVASMLTGPHGIAARASRMRGRVSAGVGAGAGVRVGVRAVRPQALTPASRSGDVQLDGLRPTPLWSSMVTRAIHRFEEFTMLLIVLHFAVGTLAILLSG